MSPVIRPVLMDKIVRIAFAVKGDRETIQKTIKVCRAWKETTSLGPHSGSPHFTHVFRTNVPDEKLVVAKNALERDLGVDILWYPQQQKNTVTM